MHRTVRIGHHIRHTEHHVPIVVHIHETGTDERVRTRATEMWRKKKFEKQQSKRTREAKTAGNNNDTPRHNNNVAAFALHELSKHTAQRARRTKKMHFIKFIKEIGEEESIIIDNNSSGTTTTKKSYMNERKCGATKIYGILFCKIEAVGANIQPVCIECRMYSYVVAVAVVVVHVTCAWAYASVSRSLAACTPIPRCFIFILCLFILSFSLGCNKTKGETDDTLTRSHAHR